MDVKEHFYNDDPSRGPADVRTSMGDVNYYFLGNGLLQAVIQVCRSTPGTPLALILMDPEKLTPKRGALNFDTQRGFAGSQALIRLGKESHGPEGSRLKARWTELGSVPQVEVTWHSGIFAVRETFFFPDFSAAMLVRRIRVHNRSGQVQKVTLETGVRGRILRKKIELKLGEERTVQVIYRFHQRKKKVAAEWGDKYYILPAADTVRFWKNSTRLSFSDPLLNHLWKAARFQLPAVLSRRGVMDGSIWQYNREWPRDQSVVARALVMSGRSDLARIIMHRLFSEFVSPEGDTVDSSERRPPAEVELDQNGFLLCAAETYFLWTGDREWVQQHWEKVRVLADFPFRSEFVHSDSGLLHNRREFWERHEAFGVEEGFELMHQIWVSLGLSAAARLARVLGENACAEKWEKRAAGLKKAVLEDRQFRLIEGGHFIKRRRLDGTVQEEIVLQNPSLFPDGYLLKAPGLHLLNPDTSSVLPVTTGFVDPQDSLARCTLAHVEALWNQKWKGGGYSRYHISSEPDSPGPWPPASLFVARAYLEAGEDDMVWRVLRWLETVPSGSHAGSFFEFYGPRLAPPAPQVGIIPWAWAEIVLLIVHHLLGIRPGDPEPHLLRIRPRMLSGLEEATVSIPIRGVWLQLKMNRAGKGEKPAVFVNGQQQLLGPGGVVIPMPDRDTELEILFPGKSIVKSKPLKEKKHGRG